MKIENQTYTRLDDDVSFQILRTNPKLTTNTKIMYDGSDIYLEAYGADPLLVTRPYKAQKTSRVNLFNNDIKNFLSGTGTTAYTVGQNMSDLTMGTTFDNQFEIMYWCGVESLPSYAYDQEMGCIAPLYLRKKLPEYFVIFKVDTPANTNMTSGDESYDFNTDVIQSARMIKTFSLKAGTAIGDYIRKYVGQKNFKYDQSIYVNFSSNEIYYYGIDRYTGVLTQKVENIKEQMLDNDYTILRTDERITCGFERNDLIFPYILNLEFLFDDDELSGDNDFKFARYFGMYCNTIDLQKVLVTGKSNDTNGLFIDWGDTEIYELNDDSSFYYVKDKNDKLYTIDKRLRVKGEIDINDCMGYEKNSITVSAERVSGRGYSTMILEVTDAFDETQSDRAIIYLKDSDGNTLKIYESSYKIDEKSFKNGSTCLFSVNGTAENIAEALAGAIKTYPPADDDWLTAYSIGNKVFIESTYPSLYVDDYIQFNLDDCMKIVKKLDKFSGGTDVDGCLFKINIDDEILFNINPEDESEKRYVNCRGDKDASIQTILPYVNDGVIDEEYSLLVTDYYGPNIKVSKNNYIELLNKYYAKIGVLSFFPVRDFDFDTISSPYGDYSKMAEELKTIKKIDDGSSDSEGEEADIPYCRFFTDSGEELKTEYDYFCENILPELCANNKTVPFINKWGYIDESKDSCENPYRLNTSKIFGTCNFSANTFVMGGDIMEYTHSMPYYIVNDKDGDINEYQYVDDVDLKIRDYSSEWESDESSGACQELITYIEEWKKFFSDTTENNFEKMFCSTLKFGNKRFNKKYSRFLNGSTVNNASTLFRGVKFEVVEMNGSKEVKTSKYNGYKFSFVYIPSGYFTSKVYFVKNDTFKFIVGMVFFNVSTRDGVSFGKANAYAGSLGYLNPFNENEDSDSDI